MEIRFVRPEEVRQLQRNVVTGFPSKTPQELLENMAGELVSPQEGRYLGCFDEDNTLIGSLLMMDFQQNIRGKLMNMGGIAYVSTGFLRKKEHIARNMIRVAIGVFAGTGTYVGGLHPFNPAFYGKMGYGYCNESMMFSPKPQYIRSFGHKEHLSYAREEDREEILKLYRRQAVKIHGATIHPYMDYHRIFDMPYVVVCRREGRITGYLTFEFTPVDHYTDMYHDLTVREMVYEDMDTLEEFLTFFARIYTPEENFQMYFTNPDSGENRAYDGAIQEIGRKNMGHMFRILSVENYFRQQDHCEGKTGRDFILELQVKDTFVEENNRSFFLKIQGGRIRLLENREDHIRADVRLETDIADLSSLAMGAISLKEFLWSRRMKCSDESYGQDIQRAIGWSEKPENYTYF